MAFPEFEEGKKGLLFFCRGRGRGHAVPDIAIARKLLTLREDVDVRFVSYSTGARTIEEHGLPLVDLGLPDANSYTDTLVLAAELLW